MVVLKHMLNFLCMIHLTGVSVICLKALLTWQLGIRPVVLHCFINWLCFYSFCSHEALEGHIQHLACCSFFQTYFCFRKKKRNCWHFFLSTDEQSVCQWARIIHNQIQSWRGNKVNPLHDPATICVSVLVIGLLCALHHKLFQPGLPLIYINTEFKQSLWTHVGSGFPDFFGQLKTIHTS